MVLREELEDDPPPPPPPAAKPNPAKPAIHPVEDEDSFSRSSCSSLFISTSLLLAGPYIN